MTQRESKLSRSIQQALRTRGAYCLKIHGSEYMQVGTPDILGCYRGRFFALETKLPESRSHVSMVQLRQMEKIKRADGLALVVCTVDEALRVLDAIDFLIDGDSE